MKIRWKITKVRDRGSYHDNAIQISQFKIYDESDNEIPISDISSNLPPFSDSFEISNIIDNRFDTKFCSTLWGASAYGNCTIEGTIPDNSNIKKYKYGTANDVPPRDPVSWEIYVSEDGVNYDLISKVDDADITTTRMVYTQLFKITWRQGDDGYPTNTSFPSMPLGAMIKPYPKCVWRIEDGANDGYPFTELMGLINRDNGAFYNVSSLQRVRIPLTVKNIGNTSFAGTSLKTVRIASDCAYSETSFPANCEVILNEI